MAFSELNIILITLILAIILIIIYFIFRKELEAEEKEKTDVYSLAYLSNAVKFKISEITDDNIYELKINKKETKKRVHQKARLSKATRNCSQGNVGEREYMKDMIKRILQDDYGINERTIDQVIPFNIMS